MLTKEIFLSNIDNYVQFLENKERSDSTISKYRLGIETFRKYANERQWQKAIKNGIIEYKKYIEDKYEFSTANLYIIALNGYLKYLKAPELCLETLKKQGEQDTLENSLTIEEYNKMLHVAKEDENDRIYHIMLAVAGTGIRISELKFLTVDALNVKGLQINNKGKIRYVPMPEELCDILFVYCKNNSIENGNIFYARSPKKPIHRSTVTRDLKEIAEKSEVDVRKAHPHNLRHLFAKRFMKVIGDIAELKNILGHSDLKSTMIYTNTTNDEKRKSMGKLGLY